MNKLSPWYITGFVEGEGAFTYSRNGQTIDPKFTVRQRHDYGDLVAAVAEFFGVGTVYSCAPCKNSQASAYYVVRGLEDLSIVIDHFEKYPLQSPRKQKAFEAWRTLVWMRRGVSRKGIAVLYPDFCKLARQISALNTRPRGFRPRKRSLV